MSMISKIPDFPYLSVNQKYFRFIVKFLKYSNISEIFSWHATLYLSYTKNRPYSIFSLRLQAHKPVIIMIFIYIIIFHLKHFFHIYE